MVVKIRGGSLLTAIFLVGFTSAVVQIVLIRELLIVFSGNELSIGLILANWLLFAAAGSYISGKLVDRFGDPRTVLALLQILVSLAFFMAVCGARTITGLMGLSPGEALDLVQMLAASLVVISPAAAIGGCAFAFACKMHDAVFRSGARSSGRIFAFDAVGSAAGGLAITFVFIPFLNSIQITLFLAILNGCSALLLLMTSPEDRPSQNEQAPPKELFRASIFPIIIVFLLSVLLFSLLFPMANGVQEKTVRAQWTGRDLKFSQNSIYGNVVVTQEQAQYTFFLDGYPLFSTPVPDLAYCEVLVHLPMAYQPCPSNVLVIGGGVGGVLQEVQKYGAVVDYVEVDPLMIAAARKFPTSLTESELNDPNVSVKSVDGRSLLAQKRQCYDGIIINLPPPSSMLLNRFYTKEFFTLANMSLTENGILVVVVPGSSVYLSDEQAYLNRCIYKTLLSVFPFVRPIPGDTNIYVASKSSEAQNISSEDIVQRLNERNIETKFLTNQSIFDKLSFEKLGWFNESINRSSDAKINEDFRPSAVLYELLVWNAKFSLPVSRLFHIFKDLNVLICAIPLVAILPIMIIVRYDNPKSSRFAISTATLTTGFFGMAYTVILATTLQSFYGYIYYLFGLLTAMFMIGLVLGSLIVTQAIGTRLKKGLALWKIELIVLTFCLVAPIVLVLLGSLIYQPVTLFIIFTLCILNGTLVGLEFPVANKTYQKNDEWSGKTAGILYSFDLLGACMGALCVSMVLLPVLGVWQTCLFVLLLKLVSLVSIVISR